MRQKARVSPKLKAKLVQFIKFTCFLCKFLHILDSGIPGEQDEVGDEWEELNVSEDQNLQVTRLLENGDDILEVYNGSIISGIDVCDCLIVSCAKSIYVIDNFYRRESGEIVDVKDLELAERNIYTSIINSDQGYAGENSSGRKWHHKRRCLLEDLKEVYKRSYLFRNVALEIFLNDGRNYLLVFVSKRERNAFYNKLQRVVLAATEESQVVNVISKGTGMLSNIISGNQFSDVTQKWVIGEMSNFAYLMYLNTLAGRTYNDLTQYPVFPWIISDYTSSTLNLNDSKIYRDLSKPMGAQGSKRANQFQERFELWDDPVIPACHYGTHYSSAMIVCSYLIRLEPFTQQYLQLQVP